MSVKFYDEVPKNLELGIKAGLTACAIEVQGAAKDRCPVRLERLRGSIIYKVRDDEATIGTNVEYAPYVEFGTGIYAEGGGGRQTPWFYYDEVEKQWFKTRGQKPHSFLRKGLDEKRSILPGIFQKQVKRFL